MILHNQRLSSRNAVVMPSVEDVRAHRAIIPTASDTMFKIMLGSEERKEYLAYFLSLILEEDKDEILENMVFVPTDLEKDNVHESNRKVDVLIKLRNKYYNIEMNNYPDISSLERNIDYSTKIFDMKRKVGSKYEYNYVCQININNFIFEPDKDNENFKEDFYITSTNDSSRILTDKIRIMYIYLPKIIEKYYNKCELSEVEKLLLVLNSKTECDYNDIVKESALMENIVNDLKDASEVREYVDFYSAEEEENYRLYHAEKKGIEEGIEQGTLQEKIATAKRMLDKNMSVEDISEFTDLDIETINNLK